MEYEAAKTPKNEQSNDWNCNPTGQVVPCQIDENGSLYFKAIDVSNTQQPDERSSPMELLKLLGYVNAMIGYCQSLKVGTVISEGYMQRMDNHYIPNTRKACMLIAKLLDKSQAPKREAVTPWQPIESVPKDGTRVLLGHLEDSEIVNIADDFWYQDRVMGGFDTYAEAFDETPTHWMPIPEYRRRGPDNA